MVPYITWKDYYSVGHESIDAEHKQIIGLINELYEAKQKGVDYKVIKPLLDRLVQYAVNHFQHEEEIMLAHQYPDFAQHKALHDKLRKNTIALRDNANLMTGRDLLAFLKDWWCNHIQDQDKKFAPYLKALVEI